MKLISSLLLSIILVACGGGGGSSTAPVVNSVPVVLNNVSTTITIPTTLGIGHATGIIPYDINHDGITDLIFTPSGPAGGDLPAFATVNQNNSMVLETNGTWGTVITTGFVKDWLIKDLNNDGIVDLAWVDHGAENSYFEFGSNVELLSNGNSLIYNQLPGGKAFWHGLAYITNSITHSVDLLVADFHQYINYYTNSGTGSFTLSTIALNNDFPCTSPGAVATMKMQDGSTAVIAGTCVADTLYSYHLNVYKLINGSLVIQPTYTTFYNQNVGAFEIITGDFFHQGYDDVLVLLENGTATRTAMYFQQVNGQLIDKTNEKLSAISQLINIPDKVVAFDVNGDGYLDLIGFGYQNNLYTNGAGIFLNDGHNHFTSYRYGGSSVNNTIQIPMFSTNSDGSWKKLIGLYGVSTPNTNVLQIVSWLSN
jgi:hypothetical protein